MTSHTSGGGAPQGAASRAALQAAYAAIPTAVAAVCAEVDGERIGMAASSVTAVSLDPGLISICVMEESRTWGRLREADRIGVSIMASDHTDAVRSLGAKDGDRFAGVETRTLPGGAVLLRGSTVALECELQGHLPAGDHQIALLRVLGLQVDDQREPLVYLARSVRSLVPHPASNSDMKPAAATALPTEGALV